MKIKVLVSLICILCVSCECRKTVPGAISIDKVFSRTYGIQARSQRVSAKPGILRSFEEYTDLSDQFNLRVFITEPDDIFVTSHLVVYIFTKTDSLCQKLVIDVEALEPIRDVIVRSYETKVNLDKPVPEEFFGKIIVGDFNFDALSDIAVVSCVPMSGTPMYDFYFQTSEFRFVKDRYFSDVVENLPQELNPEKRTFLAYYHTGCCAQTYRYFKVDANGKCKLTFKKEIDLNRD